MSFSIAHLSCAARVDSCSLAVQHESGSVTYEQLEIASSKVAAGLWAAGARSQTRVAFIGQNSIACVEVLLGAAKLGATMTLLNWRLHSHELVPLLQDCGAPIVFVDQQFADALPKSMANATWPGKIIVVDSDNEPNSYVRWREQFSPVFDTIEPGANDIVLQLYTSGTTGRPKGVMLSHQSLADSIVDANDFWCMQRESAVLLVLPMFHIAGLGTLLGALWSGAKVIISNDNGVANILRQIQEQGISHLVLVSVMLEALIQDPAFLEHDLSSLETISYGAAPIDVRLLEKLIDLTECRVMQPYGLTETAGVLTLLTDKDHRESASDTDRRHRLASCGRPRPGVELRIVDPVSARDVPQGEVGELCARTKRLMRGYANLPQETRDVMLADGWFRTGDIASISSNGYVTLHDRVKDLIISGGENIYPAEIEEVLRDHTDVLEVAVVGVQHRKWGETPVAAVVMEEGTSITVQDLLTFCRSRLAHYKCPTEIHSVQNLPRNATGKVLRKQLREDSAWRR